MKIQLSKYFSFILSVLCGVVFVYSAYTKLHPIEPFEYSLVDLGIVNWKLSPILARLLIGLEFLCAFLLITNLWLKKITIPLVSILLGLFSFYLVGLIIKYGNTGNCGCFGQAISLTPMEGIIKNIIMLLCAGFIYKFPIDYSFKYKNIIAGILCLAVLTLPFILNTINYNLPQQYLTETVNYKLDLDILYNDPDNPPPAIELRTGKHIIAFMSLTCPHCKVAAQKLRIMKMKNPSLSIHLILNGDKENIAPFFEATRADNLSWSLFLGSEKFLALSSPKLPQIYLVNESIVEKKCNYLSLEQKEIEDWLKQ